VEANQLPLPQITPNQYKSRKNGSTLPDIRASLETRQDIPAQREQSCTKCRKQRKTQQICTVCRRSLGLGWFRMAWFWPPRSEKYRAARTAFRYGRWGRCDAMGSSVWTAL